MANAVTETSGTNAPSNSSPKHVATSGTGLSYASFLVGEIDKGSFTQYLPKLDFRAEWYNVTNNTLFGVASTAVGNGTFGEVTQSSIDNRKSAEFSARIDF